MDTKLLAGIKINNLSKEEFLEQVNLLIDQKISSYVVTPYSEFIVWASKDESFKSIINSSNISTADGFGIILGLKYMELKGIYLPLIKCLLAALFYRRFFKGTIKAKLSGSEFVYDVAELAEQRGYKVFLLGGFDFGKGNSGELAKKKLQEMYPKLNIVGTYPGDSSPEQEDKI